MKKQRLDTKREVAKFDSVADQYSQLHQKSVGSSGEGIEYFAQYKVDCLRRYGVSPSARILDFGCGIGNLTQLMASSFAEVAGYDPSTESIDQAKKRGGTASYSSDLAQLPRQGFDIIVLSGVLHHVPPTDRVEVLASARAFLRHGGRAFVFEHNPNNPLTRRAVDACPFDDDAILLSPKEVRKGLREAGFGQVRQDYIVFFPRVLAMLRGLEPKLRSLPVGAQTLTIGSST